MRLTKRTTKNIWKSRGYIGKRFKYDSWFLYLININKKWRYDNGKKEIH